MAQSSIFPIFLRAEYREDANGIPKFISSIRQAANVSEQELKRVGAALNNALAAPRTSGGSLDLGTAQLREQIRAQEQAAVAAREIATATRAAAIANGELGRSLAPSIRAYFDVARAKDADAAASRAQLVALQAIETELEKGTRAVEARLQAEQNLANFRKTANINDGAARVISGQGAIDRAALSGATLESVLGRTRTSNPVVSKRREQESAEAERAAAAQAAEMERVAAAAAKQAAAIAELARTEAAAATGARLLEGIYRKTALALNETGTEFGRTAKSARESAAAFQQAFAAQEAQAEKAAAALREQTAALAALRAQINPTAVAQEQFNQKVAFAQAALDRGELSQKEYAQAVRLASAALREAGQAEVAAAAARNGFTGATRAGTTARGNVINSVRAERTAFIQLGQQLQDMTVQAQLGTNAFIIMGQQLPQAAFALSGLTDSADKTKAAVGRVATFLSGPWGAAIFVGLAVLGPFVQKLFESKEAADESGRAQRSLAEVLMDTTSSYEEVTKALQDYNRAQERSREISIVALGQQARAIAQNLNEAISIREKTKARIADLLAADQNLRATGDRGAFAFGAEAGQLQEALAEQDKQIGELKTSAQNAVVEVATEIARIQSDSSAGIREGFRVLREEANKTIADAGTLSKRLTELNKAEQRALQADRSTGSVPSRSTPGRERINREPDQLARLAEQSAERVARINERFDEQPRLIDAAAQASRQLNDVIGDINQRMATAKNLTAEQRAEFEKIKAAAADAQNTIGDALLRPFQQLREESAQRLEIEQLLAQGRTAEAAALQDIIRLEQLLGTEASLRAQVEKLIADKQFEQADALQAFIGAYGELKNEVRARVAEEERLTRIYRDQAAIFNAQLEVVQTVRRDLTDILSGRSTDFFGNFRQAIQDLQGQRLFESIFGDTFRQIEQELQGNTPQGRANAAYIAEVNKTASTTARLETAVSDLADTIVAANDNIANGGGTAAAAGGYGFNPQMGIVQAALQSSGLGGLVGINVSGSRIVETDVSRRSSIDLAERISQGIGASIGKELEDVFGPQFASMLGDIVGGAIAGKVTGGNVGGILGGLRGLTSNIPGLSGISEGLGALGQGAAIGTQIAGLGKALGLGGSTTGAQIGGALGTPFGPPGQIIGAIAGNILGGLLKKTPRASATIGGVGGSLGITSLTGTSGSLRDAAGGLGGSVLEAINRIAEQLGATVNAGAGSVSIGQRKGNLRVDPRGGGVTKIGNGAIDFGEDAEAAIAFAVRDLIQDGVITGLRASEQRLLRAGSDIEAALADVLTFRSVFDRLEEIRDPLGGAIRRLNTEFAGLIDLFERAGASTQEFADLEELYNLERARAIEEATDRVVGSLKQLLNDLTIGDSGLSLRSRRSNALGQFDELAARVAAGDTTAFDDFADISQQLLDIERQLFGSTQSYFDRLAQVTALTEAAIADQTNVTGIGAAAPSPFDDRASIARSIEAANSEQVGWLRAINDNLIALGAGTPTQAAPNFSGFGSSILNAAVNNF